MSDMTPEGLVDILAPVVEQAIAERLEAVYLAIEVMREEFQQTISVMDGNDHAIVGELQRIKTVTPAKVLEEAGEAWERFVIGEAKALGLRVVRPKAGAEGAGGASAGANAGAGVEGRGGVE